MRFIHLILGAVLNFALTHQAHADDGDLTLPFCQSSVFGRPILTGNCRPRSGNNRLRSRQPISTGQNRYGNRPRAPSNQMMSRRGNRPQQGTKNRGCGATPSPSPSKPPVAPPTETRGRKTRPPTRSPTGRPTGAPTASIATAPPTRRPSAAPSAKPSAAPSPRARLITPAPTRKPTQAPVRPTPPPTTRPTPTPTYAPSRSPSAAPTTPLSRSGGQRCCEDARDPTGNPYGTLTGTVTPQDITAFDPFIVNITYAESGITMSTSAGCGGSNPDSASYLVIKAGRLCWTQGIDYGVSASPGPCRNNTIYSLVEGINFWQLVGVDESNIVMLGQLDLTCLSTC